MKNVVDSLASSGDISQAVDEVVSEVPELFRSVSTAVTKPVETVVAPVPPPGPGAGGLHAVLVTKATEVVKNNTPPVVLGVLGGVHTWWTDDRLKNVVQGTVPRRETDGLIIQGSFELSEPLDNVTDDLC